MEQELENKAQAQEPMQEETPQEAMQEEPMQEADPFDTSVQEKELSALEDEIAQSEASIESDFAKFAASNVSPELEELFFENREEFFARILSMQNEFLQEKIGQKAQRATELTNDIANKKQTQNFERAKQMCAQEHPETNIDELMAFFEEIPPDIQAELKKLNPLEFLETLLEIQKQMQGGDDVENDQIPTQLKGVPSTDGVSGSDSDLPMQRL